MQVQGRRSSGKRRQRNWLGWGLALFILGACALFLDLGQVVRPSLAAFIRQSCWACCCC